MPESEKLKPGFEKEDRLDRARRIEWMDIDRISQSSALLLGAGALGNELGKNLALSGFKSITVVDFDHVERSNLSRCLLFTEEDARSGALKAETLAKKLSSISEEMTVSFKNLHVKELPREEFSRHDLIFGCLDNVNARLHANAFSYAEGKPYIDGGMQGLLGRIFVSKPPDGPCLECATNSSHSKIAAIRFSCTGSNVNMFTPPVPAEITTTSIVSAIAAREGIRLLSEKAPALDGQMIFYDGLNNSLELMELEIDSSCSNHIKIK